MSTITDYTPSDDTQRTVLDWDHEDTRPSLEAALSTSKAKAMVELKEIASTLTSQEIWEAMNVTAQKSALAIFDNRSRFRELRAGRLEAVRLLQERLDAQVDERSDQVQALMRTAKKHSTGLKSERLQMHLRLLESLLGDAGRSGESVTGFHVAFMVDGHQFERSHRFDSETGWAFCMERFDGDREAAERHFGYMRSTGSISDLDELVFVRKGRRHPNRQVAYIAPFHLSDAQADVYERLRADGMSPAEADQAAQLV